VVADFSRPIDYANLDFASMREAMLDLAADRLPEWTDRTPNDVGVVLLELFAYAADLALYHQSRIAANLLPETSEDPQALVQLLRLLGYELRSAAPATAMLRVAFDAVTVPPVLIPADTQFTVALPGGELLTFETERDISAALLTPPDAANLRYFFPVPVVEGRTVPDETLGISDASPNQLFDLQEARVIDGSIRVAVDEPGGATRWTVVESLAESSPADRHCLAQRQADGRVTIVFGDGTNGLIPPEGTPALPVTVRARYRIGGGARGNVAPGTAFRSSLAVIRQATNPAAAGGGQTAEDVQRARAFAPRLYRTQERAVTTRDYEDWARKVPGAGKVRAVAASWNQILLFVAPAGRVAEPSEILRRDLLAFLERRRMASTELKVVGPGIADIYLAAEIQAQPYFLLADVERAVQDAVARYLDFDAVSFGQAIHVSRIYDQIQSLPQVASLLITRFSRDPNGGVDANGTIELEPHELPRPGYRDNPETPADPLNPEFRPAILAIVRGAVTP
jgi:hypothetical protein